MTQALKQSPIHTRKIKSDLFSEQIQSAARTATPARHTFGPFRPEPLSTDIVPQDIKSYFKPVYFTLIVIGHWLEKEHLNEEL